MGYKLAIFDLDGTVLDSLDDLANSTNAALRAHGYPERTRQEICQFVGNGMARLIARAVPVGTDDNTTAAVLATFKAYYADHCAEKTAPYAGVLQLLARLRAAGVKLAVLSNKADAATKSLCHTYFEGAFDLVVGERESEGVRKKPAPDAVFAILRELQVDAAEAVYIGDSEVDVQTAQNAGLALLAVTWGFRSEAVLRESGAAVLVDNAKTLGDLILS